MLASHPWLSVRKRFRGKRRYFAGLDRWARQDVLAVGPWYYEHQHLDLLGRGNLSWRFRRQTLSAHITLLKNWAAQLRGHPGDFQLWLRVAVPDAWSDSVYVHSPNPHGEFPADFSGVVWSTETTPRELANLDPDLVWGHSPHGDYYAFIPGVGRDPTP
jgi:hypothetical protein